MSLGRGVGFEVSYVRAVLMVSHRSHSFLLLPVDQDIKLSASFPPPCPTMMIWTRPLKL